MREGIRDHRSLLCVLLLVHPDLSSSRGNSSSHLMLCEWESQLHQSPWECLFYPVLSHEDTGHQRPMPWVGLSKERVEDGAGVCVGGAVRSGGACNEILDDNRVRICSHHIPLLLEPEQATREAVVKVWILLCTLTCLPTSSGCAISSVCSLGSAP